jgi:CoA:oxalate CoA-transferase
VERQGAAPRPLRGVRVIDLSRVVSGPLCGRMLADLGADVIKLEPPDGDRTRTVPPFVDGVSPYFAQMNAGKRNLSVDLKAPDGPALVARLAATADVLLENFRPGVMARFGLDASTLLEANPQLVYCSVTGWGQDGPWADRRAFAPLVHADVGTLELAARHRGRRPEQEINQHADVYSAFAATNAVLAALLQRESTGRGQHIDIAMGQVAVYANEWAAVDLQEPADDYGLFDTWNHHSFRLGDGSYVALTGNPVDWLPMWARSFGAPEDLLADPRFETRESRVTNLGDVLDVVDQMTQTFEDFSALEAVLDPWMLAAQVRSVAALADTPWADHRHLFGEVAPGLRIPSALWSSSDATVGAAGPVSGLGADNHDVLAELGFSTEEIDDLERNGVLRTSDTPHVEASR